MRLVALVLVLACLAGDALGQSFLHDGLNVTYRLTNNIVVTERLYAKNPRDPDKQYGHHWTFSRFHPFVGKCEEQTIYNFLGMKTRADRMCTGNYPVYYPGRKEDCEQLRRCAESRYKHVRADFPLVDEEYFEWVALLEAVIHAAAARLPSFNMIEVGAGYAPWTTSAAKALRHLNFTRPMALTTVEAMPTLVGWMREHLAANGVCEGNAGAGGGGPAAGRAAFSLAGRDVDFNNALTGATDGPHVNVSVVTLGELHPPRAASPGAAGGEDGLFTREVVATTLARTRAVVVATHYWTRPEVESEIIGAFQAEGWIPLMIMSPKAGFNTEAGPVAVIDGLQSWLNPRFDDALRPFLLAP
eukprot:tig00001477_g8894.t1